MLTAVLFGLHPTKVESVAWVGSSMVDGLGAVFFFVTLIAFLKWHEHASTIWLATSVASFAGAMFTKETMVCIPILIAFYLGLMTMRAERIRRMLQTLPLYGIVWIVYMTIRHQVIKPPSPTAEYIHPTFTLSNLWTAPYAIWWYIRHLVFPWGLSVEYADSTLKEPTLLGFVLPAVGLLLLLVASCWLWLRQRSKLAAFLIFWFVLTLAPAVLVAPMVLQHDRYLYLSSYAFGALVAWAILKLGNLRAGTRLLAVLCVVALCSGVTWHEMGYWESDAKLWPRALEISPSSVVAQIHTASIYNNSGDAAKALQVLDDGLRYHPSGANLWVSRSLIYQANREFEQARAGYLKVIQMPEIDVPISVRAAAAHQMTLLNFSEKNFVEAEHYARVALSLNPMGFSYHRALARSLREQGRVAEASAEEALELKFQANVAANSGSNP
jgi:tetratricopeptide (TPR) repeat protein